LRGGGRPITPQTLFCINSNSKDFMALASMQFFEQRRVSLDAPVQRYLPWFHLADADASGLLQQARGNSWFRAVRLIHC
jgi:CubicO group peptidase (beta-lactamase class C family)